MKKAMVVLAVLLVMAASGCDTGLQDKIDQLEKDNDQLKKDKTELEQQVEQLTTDKTALEARKTQLEAELAEAVANGANPAEIARLEGELAAANAQLAQCNNFLSVMDWINEKEADGTTPKRKQQLASGPDTFFETKSNLDIFFKGIFMQEAFDYFRQNPDADAGMIKAFAIERAKVLGAIIS